MPNYAPVIDAGLKYFDLGFPGAGTIASLGLSAIFGEEAPNPPTAFQFGLTNFVEDVFASTGIDDPFGIGMAFTSDYAPAVPQTQGSAMFGDLIELDSLMPGEIGGMPDVSYGGGSQDWARIFTGASQIFSDTPGGGTQVDTMPGVVNAGFPALAGLGSLAAVAGRSLASVFGGAGISRAAGAIFNLNGIKGKVAALWPYVRKHGPAAVASALGVSVATLGSMLLAEPERKRRRRRGISGRDIRTTRRVVGFVNRISHDIGCVKRPTFKRKC